MEKIFISHPYADDPLGNIEKVDFICKRYDYKKYLVLSPLHLFSHYEDLEVEPEYLRNAIMDICYSLIDLADEVHIYGYSDGCLKEYRYALSKGKVIKLFDDAKKLAY